MQDQEEAPKGLGIKDAGTEDVPAFLHERGFIGILFSAAHAHRDKLRLGLEAIGLPDWTGSQFSVLSRVYDSPMSQAEVAKLLHITPPSAMELVKRLESEGYVTRERDPRDGRRRMVTITSRARTYIENARRQFAKSMEASEAALWAQGFTPDDMERCKALLSAYTELSREETQRLQAMIASQKQHGAA